MLWWHQLFWEIDILLKFMKKIENVFDLFAKRKFYEKTCLPMWNFVLQEYLRHIMKPFSLFRIILVFRVLYILMISFWWWFKEWIYFKSGKASTFNEQSYIINLKNIVLKSCLLYFLVISSMIQPYCEFTYKKERCTKETCSNMNEKESIYVRSLG